MQFIKNDMHKSNHHHSLYLRPSLHNLHSKSTFSAPHHIHIKRRKKIWCKRNQGSLVCSENAETDSEMFWSIRPRREESGLDNALDLMVNIFLSEIMDFFSYEAHLGLRPGPTASYIHHFFTFTPDNNNGRTIFCDSDVSFVAQLPWHWTNYRKNSYIYALH